MSKSLKLFGLSVAFSLLSVTLVFAAKYSEGSVSNGGSISGKVSFKGAVPAPKEFKLGLFPQADFCGKVDSKDGIRFRQDVNVKDGGLGDVVVYIEKIKKGKAFNGAPEAKIVADNCRFLIAEGEGPSRMVGVVLNTKKTGKKAVIKVKNLDSDPSDPKTAAGILHNPHGYDVKGVLRKTIFNKPVPKKDQEITIKVKKRWFKKKETFMLTECDQHNYMNVWNLPVNNPYYAIVNADGTYKIGDIPAGKYEVKAFHPALGFVKQSITVKGGADAAGNFEFAAK
ncbi:MAG: carboxypeptidase-like regulatory domain-containing protein [Nitrospiria bacterium]